VSRRYRYPSIDIYPDGGTIMTEEQQNAQHALQESMDRRDNGGETGH
jgi:hypothetical protein